MRVLMTGGYGFIGAWIARSLLARGDDVFVFDLKEDPRRFRLILPGAEIAKCKFVPGDVTDLAALTKAIRDHGVTHVIHLAGLQVCIHAIGDQANRSAAELYGRLLREHPAPHRHRVEHASVLDEPTIAAFAELGITCVVQPINLRTEAHWLAARLGADRLHRAQPKDTDEDDK